MQIYVPGERRTGWWNAVRWKEGDRRSDKRAVCVGQPESSRAYIRIKWNYIKMDFNRFGFYCAGETKLSEVF